MGVLSALPIVYAGNACCCLWVVTGGVAAAYVFQQNQAGPIMPGDGAVVGLLAGLVGAVVHLVLSIPIDIVMAPIERSIALRLADMAGNLPNMRETIEQFTRRSAGAGLGLILIRRMVVFVVMLFIGSIFSTIGGLIGAVVFRKSTPPPGTIDIPSHA